MPASFSAWLMARIAPSPCGCGAEIWYASLDSPAPRSATSPGSRVSTISAAASPMVIPRRLRPNGSHRVGEKDSRLLKPLTGMRLRLSAPPTMATSTSPASIRRRPLMIARALEEQAVEMVYAGPSSASQLARKRDGSPSSCCGYCHCGLRSPFCARRTYSSPSSSPEVLVPSTTATRSRPTRAMAASTAGRICASAASSSWLLRLRCAEKDSGTGGSSPSTPPSTASGKPCSQPARWRIPGATPAIRFAAISSAELPSALTMPTAER